MSEEKVKVENLGDHTLNLRHDLTPDEKKVIAENISESIGNKNQLEADIQGIKNQYKAKIAAIDGKIETLAAKYRQGYEFRDIEVILKLNYETKKREYYDKTTGLILKLEPFKDSDNQRFLQFEKQEKEAQEKAEENAKTKPEIHHPKLDNAPKQKAEIEKIDPKKINEVKAKAR